jgi:hypothetical protein
LIPLLEVTEHLSMFFLFLLLGPYQEKIEYGEHQDEGNKSAKAASLS